MEVLDLLELINLGEEIIILDYHTNKELYSGNAYEIYLEGTYNDYDIVNVTAKSDDLIIEIDMMDK